MKQIEDLTFEAAFAELEQTVTKLESGGLTLEESLAVFERGRNLAAHCSQKLEEAELQVKQITPDGDVPFEVEG
ncbi:MAG: exodeoxyribonuclease VII small subunit [Anaerolineae bacterium]|jgi:exodeoxyribonuclease VII small subunit